MSEGDEAIALLSECSYFCFLVSWVGFREAWPSELVENVWDRGRHDLFCDVTAGVRCAIWSAGVGAAIALVASR